MLPSVLVEICPLWLKTCHLSWSIIINVAKKNCHLSWLKLWCNAQKNCNLSSVMLRICITKVEKLSSVMLGFRKKNKKKADICHLSWSKLWAIEKYLKNIVYIHSIYFVTYCSCNYNAVAARDTK